MQCCQPESLPDAFMQALTELDCMPSPSLSSNSSASGMRMEVARPTSSALRLSAPPLHNPPGESRAAHSGADGSSAAGTWAQGGQQDSPGDGLEAKQPRRRQAWVLEKMRGARKSLDSSRWADGGSDRVQPSCFVWLSSMVGPHVLLLHSDSRVGSSPFQWQQQALAAG